ACLGKPWEEPHNFHKCHDLNIGLVERTSVFLTNKESPWNAYLVTVVKCCLIDRNFERVAASCVWHASKLEESPRKARQVLIVFHRMECRKENLPTEHLDPFSTVNGFCLDILTILA
ncbi:hypothetical protein RJ641_023572, partial [Dillenia turbinata]